MNRKLRPYRIIYCTLLCITILAYVLLSFELFWIGLAIAGALFSLVPVLVAETEVYSSVKYFVFEQKLSKVKTLLMGMRFLFGAGFLLYSLISLIALPLKQIQIAYLVLLFGAAIILLGLSKLIYSSWEIVTYWRNALKRNIGKVLLLAAGLCFSLLIIGIGYGVTLYGIGLGTFPR